jgi:hypothetical protein
LLSSPVVQEVHQRIAAASFAIVNLFTSRVGRNATSSASNRRAIFAVCIVAATEWPVFFSDHHEPSL